ncbi:M48 family metallopeptidase [Mangrovibacillus cuniculi]|uniref:M48 family metallopeptidase n=1 Tax=Mangrovibacillus cuniculi TaxID=2593652 RepID=A0A7S8C9R9_9BACI|nr:M48 family metallopeptidase [Mangrovibacillus cuniculi]QPC46015.1 M48 family metallopeptidase [Mangrovibacillus cuniculi]
MRRKWLLRLLTGYVLFGIAMYIYLYFLHDGTVPDSVKGTAADPSSFMNSREWTLSQEYSTVKNLLFFLATPFEWVFLLGVFFIGLSKKLEDISEGFTKWKAFHTAMYTVTLSLLSFVAMFPFSYASYHFSKLYHISNETFQDWMKDEIINFWVDAIIMVPVFIVLFMLMRKYPKNWWFPAWLLSVPFTVFLLFIQPVVLDPLFNEFSPLQDKELETKILAMAQEAEIPTDHVYQVNKSAETNAMNAYVTGIGSNARIVLWDTTLESLTDEEILFIMAHEISHYREKDIYWGLASYLFLTLLGLYISARVLTRFEQKESLVGFDQSNQLRVLPILLVTWSLLSFAISPVENWVSRTKEVRSDQYALSVTGNEEAAVSTFQKLTLSSLGEMNPPLLVKWFRYGHPPMVERILLISDKE